MTNAETYSGIISQWANPALIKIMADRLSCMPFVHNVNNVLVGSGIVSSGYKIETEISPLIEPIINSIAEPCLFTYLSKIPDNAIPGMVSSLCEHIKSKGMISFLDGFIIVEADDIAELEEMINRTLTKQD